MAFDNDEDFSGSDSDEGFQEDMEALKKACLLAGKETDDLQPSCSPGDIGGGHVTGTVDVTPSGTDADDVDDDIELVRSIQERFALSTELREPLTLKPLCSLPPPGSEGDDDDDDFETLRAIQRRFAAYHDDSGKGRKESSLNNFEQMEPHRFLMDAVMKLLVLRISLSGMIPVLKTQQCQLILFASQNQHRHLLRPSRRIGLVRKLSGIK